jgi:hypothetical protein
MSSAKDDALETPSGTPLDTDPAETASGREPVDADGIVEPDRHDPRATRSSPTTNRSMGAAAATERT